MKLSELMKNHTPSTSFEGFVTNDDFVLAVDCSTDGSAASVGDYAVVQIGVSGLDAQLNPVTQDKQYIRAGQSTTKTGTQRSNSVVRDYVYFCLLNGQGEKGKCSIIVNSDGAGDAGETSEIDIELKKSGDAPASYTYSAAG